MDDDFDVLNFITNHKIWRKFHNLTFFNACFSFMLKFDILESSIIMPETNSVHYIQCTHYINDKSMILKLQYYPLQQKFVLIISEGLLLPELQANNIFDIITKYTFLLLVCFPKHLKKL